MNKTKAKIVKKIKRSKQNLIGREEVQNVTQIRNSKDKNLTQ